MNKLFKMTMVLALALSVSGSVWASPHHKSKGVGPKSHHNPHKPGPASNAKPGGHQKNQSVKPS